MLARKRKLQDDEPLVPHGLVSQALDAETAPSEVPSLDDRKISPELQPKAQDRDPSLPKPPRPAEAARPPKVSSGRLLRWPKMREHLGGSHTPQFLARLRDLWKRLSEHAASGWEHLNLAGPWSRIWALGETRINQARDELRFVREHAIPELQKVRDSVELPAKVARVRQGVSAGRTKALELYQLGRAYGAVRLRELMKHSRPTMRTTWNRIAKKVPRKSFKLRPTLDGSVSAGAVGVFRLRETPGAGHIRALLKRSRPAMGAAWTGIAQKVPRNGFKLRVRLDGVPLKMRIAFARAKLEWQLGRESLSKESRVWTSIALGALAALLMMGLFSTARHFAQAALPSSRVIASSSRETNATSTASLAPQPLKKTATPKAISKQIPAKPEPQQPKPKAAAAKPKVRRNADEDYVAKDTYVYYGKRASR